MKSDGSKHHGFIAVVIALYWTVSISMVFLNKHILSGTFGGELTIFSAWFQSLSAVGFIVGIGYTSARFGLGVSLPAIEPSQLLSKNMVLLSMTSVVALTFNNLMLKHIGVAFYQVARSFTIIFTIILSAVMLKKALPLKATFACLLVISGFFIGIDQEDASGTLSVYGIIYGLVASLSAAVCGILFKKTETILDRDSLKLAYFNNLNSMILFLPLVISSGQFSSVMESDYKYQPRFWILLSIGGCFSLALGWVSALQIKYTSPVAHHLSINAKSVMQTVLAVIFYHESKTLFWWLGNLLVVFGIFLYAVSKIQEDRAAQARMTLIVSVPNGDLKKDGSTD